MLILQVISRELDEPYIRRALAAYMTDARELPAAASVVELNARRYVVIETPHHNVVYRVGNDGLLRRMRRPPRDLLSFRQAAA